MPRFLRIKNTMIHIPSLSSVTVGTSCLGYPYIHLSYHTQQELKVSYSSWEHCEKDFNRVKSAVKEVESSLEKIILTEETIPSLSKVDVGQVDIQPVVIASSESITTS
jgi:hypothetical protein